MAPNGAVEALDISGKVGSNDVGVVSLVSQKRLWRLLRQGDKRVIGLAIGPFAYR